MAVLRPRRTDEIDPFSDLLFNTLLIFVMLFTVALLAMNPKAKTGVIDAKAEFIVTVTWPVTWTLRMFPTSSPVTPPMRLPVCTST